MTTNKTRKDLCDNHPCGSGGGVFHQPSFTKEHVMQFLHANLLVVLAPALLWVALCLLVKSPGDRRENAQVRHATHARAADFRGIRQEIAFAGD